MANRNAFLPSLSVQLSVGDPGTTREMPQGKKIITASDLQERTTNTAVSAS